MSGVRAQTTIDPAPFMVAEVELRPLQVQGELAIGVLAAPAGNRRSFMRRHRLFIATVIVPVFFAALYLFVIASDRYASEANFIVRSTANDSAVAGLESMVQSSGTSRAADETFAVNDYLTSRDAVDLLVGNNKLRDILSRPEADIFNRFPNFWSHDNKEQLYRRYQSMVTATIDDTTGISTIEVNAFRAADAQALTTALLGYAEGIVNKLNERAYQDALKTSNHFVDLALADVKAAESDLSAFRNNSGMVDPNHESDSTLRIIESLSIDLARIQATMSQQAALTPNSPKAAALREQVHSLEDEIMRRKLQIAGANASAANQLGKFEELVLKRELAAKSLENAVLSRDKARQNVEQQHMYVQTITQPNLPDTARYPRTMLDLLGVGAISLLIFLVLRGFRDVALEHKA